MQCLKVCGYLCGTLAAINIWFWIGMTIMQATASDGMGNPWINKEILLYDKFLDPDAHRFVTVFALCVVVSDPFVVSLTFRIAERSLLPWMLLLHDLLLLLRQRPDRVLHESRWPRRRPPNSNSKQQRSRHRVR